MIMASPPRLASTYPSSHIRRGRFAYPLQAIQIKKKRCLEASRKEYVDGSADIRMGSHHIRRYVSADGMLYFGHEQFLSPNNLTNDMVFAAFLVASTELSQYFAAQNFQSERFEVVIVLQCISLTELQFSYYFVDHQIRRVLDEPILLGDINDHQEVVGWNVADHNYWDHVATFSAHRLCTTGDYDRALWLLSRLQPQTCEFQLREDDQYLKYPGTTVASPDMQHDDTLSDLEKLRNLLLSSFDRTRINAHATASIAKIMKRIFAPPSAPKPRDPASLGSTILRSLRGIVHLGDPDDNEDSSGENAEDDAHPTAHEGSFECMTLSNETSSQAPTGGWRLRIGWSGHEE